MKMIEAVTAITECDGKVLLVQCPAHSDQVGLQEFAGGKAEPDESQRQALAHELNEELGIEATVGDYVASHQREVSGWIIHLHAWHISDPHGTLQVHEHQALVWCSSEEALRYPLAPADISLLEALMAPRAVRPADQCLGFYHLVGIIVVFLRF